MAVVQVEAWWVTDVAPDTGPMQLPGGIVIVHRRNRGEADGWWTGWSYWGGWRRTNGWSDLEERRRERLRIEHGTATARNPPAGGEKVDFG